MSPLPLLAVASLALVPSSVTGLRTQQQQQAAAGATSGLISLRAGLLESIRAGQMPQGLPPKFDCGKFPQLCQAPFDCQTFNPSEVATTFLRGAAWDGKANVRLWCMVPHYAPYVSKCLVDNDLVEAGKIQFNWSVNQHNGVDEMDASYCFIEGHCTNAAVTNDTTLEESYQMCDDRYGHDAWTKFGSLPTLPETALRMSSQPPNFSDGFHDPQLTKVFLKAACAMGNYHCDVMYCKATYCTKKHYIEKFSHLLPKAPGHLIQQRDWLE